MTCRVGADHPSHEWGWDFVWSLLTRDRRVSTGAVFPRVHVGPLLTLSFWPTLLLNDISGHQRASLQGLSNR